MTSSPEQDDRFMQLLAVARQKSSPEREIYLRIACDGDEHLRNEIVDALSSEERMGEFLQVPVGLMPDESNNSDHGLTMPVIFTTGLRVGQYRIESKLGEGGMSTVYLAIDTKLQRHVAIKFLSDDLADAEARRRFQREAQMASSLNHPHIVTVHESYLQIACKGEDDLQSQIADELSSEERMGRFMQLPVGLIPDKGAQSDDTITRPAHFSAGLLVGQYRIESRLGEGGMSTVYLALDTKLQRHVAIKFLSDDLADAEARRRFQREAQMASSLNHPHIVTVYDIGEFEGRQYLVTEYVDGGTLKDWVKDKRRTTKEVAELLTGVADGLAAAHQAGILHRDIKPMNILVARNGYAKLADFGLAKLAPSERIEVDPTWSVLPTQKGAILGTIAYMSPEQALGESLDSRSDIFSFAVVLYEMVSGKRPFDGRTDLEVLKTIIDGNLRPLSADTPAAYRNIVEKALEKKPAERYQSMREIVVDLKRAQRPPLPQPVPPPRLRLKALAAIPIAIFTVGIIAMAWHLLRPQPRPLISGIRMITSDGQAKFGPMATDGSRIYFNALLPDPRNVVSQVSVKGGEAIPVSIQLPTPAVLDVSKDGSILLVSSGVLANSLGVDPASLWLQPVAGDRHSGSGRSSL